MKLTTPSSMGPQIDQSAVEYPGDSDSKRLTIAFLSGLLICGLLLALTFVGIKRQLDQLPNSGANQRRQTHNDGLRDREVLRTDGKSNMPGNYASLEYRPLPGEHEITYDDNIKGLEHNGAYWSIEDYVPGGRVFTLFMHYGASPGLGDQSVTDRMVAARDAKMAAEGAPPSSLHKVVRIDGRTGYAWDHYKDRLWYYVLFPGAEHTYIFSCTSRHPGIAAYRSRCKAMVRTIKFHDDRAARPLQD